MTTVNTLGGWADSSNSGLMFRNKLINGGFDIWQRGTSQTSSGYGSDDRWTNDNSGSTKTASQQTFTLGQTDVPNNPKYFARTVVSSVAGASNYCLKYQKIENVATLSGQTATLSFWAKADASRNMAVEITQNFGSGGTPSSQVTGIGVTTCALNTTWKYFTVTVSIPSISGKTPGTNNDSLLGVVFWFDAGSTFNARTNSLGQQSGTFDIANVQLEAGSQATPFEQRPIGLELSLCQRYFEKSFALETAPASNLGDVRNCNVTQIVTAEAVGFVKFAVNKRANPNIVTYSAVGTGANWHYWNGSAFTQVTTSASGQQGRFQVSLTATLTFGYTYLTTGQWTAESEL